MELWRIGSSGKLYNFWKLSLPNLPVVKCTVWLYQSLISMSYAWRWPSEIILSVSFIESSNSRALVCLTRPAASASFLWKHQRYSCFCFSDFCALHTLRMHLQRKIQLLNICKYLIVVGLWRHPVSLDSNVCKRQQFWKLHFIHHDS